MLFLQSFLRLTDQQTSALLFTRAVKVGVEEGGKDVIKDLDLSYKGDRNFKIDAGLLQGTSGEEARTGVSGKEGIQG